MIGKIKLRVKPEEFGNKSLFESILTSKVQSAINDYRIIRKSVDARQKQVWIDLDIEVATQEDLQLPVVEENKIFKDVSGSPNKVVIVGAGPSGLFAALRALELGIKPIIIERGKPVEERLKDVVALQKEGRLDNNSNFCFGEGGAGTFSDGKLFTRSKKRGSVRDILLLLHQHGAQEEILYETHPHIGSEKLPGIIKNIRETILKKGGEIRFETIFDSLILSDGEVKGIVTTNGEEFHGPVIMATGHSAHDIYHYLHDNNIELEPKGFAMGVRLEHPQQLIDKIFYHNPDGRGKWLPAAEYSLACQIDDRGVYSFCMCPGGVIVPAASSEGEGVVNGMSASGRNGKWANSGMVVEIRPEDFPEYMEKGPLGLLDLQSSIEKNFYMESNSYKAPAQRMKDFTDGHLSETLPKTSYVPGIYSADMYRLLPRHVASRLRKGLAYFGRKNKGFLTNDAVLIGLESRTSSPVRIPRDKEHLHHKNMPGLYPVGEGAGYAGGIVSSAIDGRNAVDAIKSKYYAD